MQEHKQGRRQYKSPVSPLKPINLQTYIPRLKKTHTQFIKVDLQSGLFEKEKLFQEISPALTRQNNFLHQESQQFRNSINGILFSQSPTNILMSQTPIKMSSLSPRNNIAYNIKQSDKYKMKNSKSSQNKFKVKVINFKGIDKKETYEEIQERQFQKLNVQHFRQFIQIKQEQKIQTDEKQRSPQIKFSERYLNLPKTSNEIIFEQFLCSADKQIVEENANMTTLIDNLIQLKINKDGFKIIFIIASGKCSQLLKVEFIYSRSYFTMKIMNKHRLVQNKQVYSIMSEKRILSQMNHTFISNVCCSFQDLENLYIVSDLLTGGNLRSYLSERKKSDETQSRFIIACVITALLFVHQRNIIHGDIRPENIIFDRTGYVRLVNFKTAQFSSINNGQDPGGSIDYIAPERIFQQDYTFVSDYFSLGIVAFELMFDKRPYRGQTDREQKSLYLGDQVHISKQDIPKDWSLAAADFIIQMIKMDPIQRLREKEIKNHAWFSGFSWDQLYRKEIISPYIPESIDENIILRNLMGVKEDFNEKESDENIINRINKDSFQKKFKGWDYQNYELLGMKKISLTDKYQTKTKYPIQSTNNIIKNQKNE